MPINWSRYERLVNRIADMPAELAEAIQEVNNDDRTSDNFKSQRRSELFEQYQLELDDAIDELTSRIEAQEPTTPQTYDADEWAARSYHNQALEADFKGQPAGAIIRRLEDIVRRGDEMEMVEAARLADRYATDLDMDQRRRLSQLRRQAVPDADLQNEVDLDAIDELTQLFDRIAGVARQNLMTASQHQTPPSRLLLSLIIQGAREAAQETQEAA